MTTSKPSLARRAALPALIALLALAIGGLSIASCGDQSSRKEKSFATKVSSRHQLIGGLNSLGEVGDYLLENDEIRLIVQNTGYNRGAGLFGGSMIDADLVRTNHDGDVYGGNGQDTFGELFPAFFLEMINPDTVEVINDGSDGKAAIVEVRGYGGEFVTMLRYINQLLVNTYDGKEPSELATDAVNDELEVPDSDGKPFMEFSTRYILEPGARHVRIESTIENISFDTKSFPNKEALDLVKNFINLSLDGFTVPTGHVLGFGAVNDIFVPGIGYDMRWGLEDAYRKDTTLPAFPGQLAKFVAASNPDGVSYGFFPKVADSETFVCNKDRCRDSCTVENCPKDCDPKTNPDCLSKCDVDESCLYGGRAERDDLLMLFYLSGFGAALTHEIPEKLAPSYCEKGKKAKKVCNARFSDCDDESCKKQKKECIDSWDACLNAKKDHPSSYTYTNYFVVGNGSVSSILDEMYEVRGTETRKVQGRIFDHQSGSPVGADVELQVYKPRPGTETPEEMCSETGRLAALAGSDTTRPVIFSQTFTNSEGYFKMTLPPGHYCYRTHETGRPLGGYHHFQVGDSNKFLRVEAKSYATIQARLTNAEGMPMPSKLTIVGTHDHRGDVEKRFFLYDLAAGEPWRTSDFVDDVKGEPDTRRYVEDVDYASTDGTFRTQVRPGEYELWFSRGPEYEAVKRKVDLQAGETARLNVSLEKVVDTKGYLSGDFHMHAQGSIDSGFNYTDRVISIAAEDVEVVVSSDHNYISDYLPYIRREGLQRWMKSIVGVELTTFEFGHFNAFPLEYETGRVNRGSIKWQNVPPQQIFDELRSIGSISPDETVIQVNHPRDSILGYFGQFNVDGFRGDAGLSFQRAEELQSKVISAITTPSGEAFVRDCRPEDVDCTGDCKMGECEEPRYETKFSWDFDAIEIFNGKRFELLRHYRVPYGEGEWPEETVDALTSQICEDTSWCDNPDDPVVLVEDLCCEKGYASPTDEDCTGQMSSNKGKCPVDEMFQKYLSREYPKDAVLCDGKEIAYPGGLDDWYNTLNYPRPYIENEPGATQKEEPVYHKITATGNSDSHHAGNPDHLPPGHPRNYFWVGHDDPQNATEQQLVDAMQNHRNIVTNGPFVLMQIKNGDQKAEVGQQMRIRKDDAKVRVTVRAADWVGADRFRILANGEPLQLDKWNDNAKTNSRGWMPIELGDDHEWVGEFDIKLEKDTWFVLEVKGDKSMFPVYPPEEIPQLPFDEILGQIAGSFGFGGDIEGFAPDDTNKVKPFAFTNPIWIVRDKGKDDDGKFTPPAPDGKTVCEGNTFDPNALVGSREHDPTPRVQKRLDTVRSPVDLGNKEQGPLSAPRGEMRDVRTLFRAWGGH